jgi:hypothetical protein
MPKRVTHYRKQCCKTLCMEKKITGIRNSLWILVWLSACHVIKALADSKIISKPRVHAHSTKVCANIDAQLHLAIMRSMHNCIHMLHTDE